ncbi:MAG: TetR/AcrR family transcriptional regulator [Candidatus Methanomethylophilus sp.]|jgi:AcrR family transcriptional regulator|nr:TetR/AcrR family transcriptional regulator [Methanomethylophilus sp.]MCI2074993.1 TetR/AcrR family transcriptional regulator [Methanomethylophilus sp.]MCI2093681.1 TetR/AcrR family transcriptional regulator [Methanomethylophilus sp.]
MGKDGLHSSMKNVVKQAKCSETLIYKYYGTRKKLMFACFDSICNELRVELSVLSASDISSKEEFKNYIRGIWDILYQYFKNNEERRRFFAQYCSDLKYDSKNTTILRIVKNILNDNYSIFYEHCGDWACLMFMQIVFEAILVSSSPSNDESLDNSNDAFDILLVGLEHHFK